MANLIADEILIECEAILAGKGCKNVSRLVRSSRRDFLASVDERSISEVMENSATSFEVGHSAKSQPGCFHCRSCCRDPAWPALEKRVSVSICKSYGSNTGAVQLQKDRVLANDLQHLAVGKTLFVITEQSGYVDAGENRSLSRSTLRPAFNTEAGVSGYNNAVMRGF